MKKMMLGALCIVFGFAANAATRKVQIGGLYYLLNDETRTAEVVADSSYKTTLTDVEIPERVTDGDTSYVVTSIGDCAFEVCTALKLVSAPFVTSIGMNAFTSCSSLESVPAPHVTSIGDLAFLGCTSLKSVSAPSVTSIGLNAFGLCISLASLTVNSAMKAEWESKRDYYGISDSVNVSFVTTPTLTRDQVAQAGYEVKEAEVETTVSVKVVADPSVTLKVGEQTISEDEYANACAYYGIKQQTKPETPPVPTADDFKIVSKDAQVVQEGEIAVKKESIAAPSAGTVKVEDGKVQLGVAVLKTSDLTAEKKDWGEVKITKEDIDVDADGNIIVNVPVDSQSGFMVIQTKDAKVGTGNAD